MLLMQRREEREQESASQQLKSAEQSTSLQKQVDELSTKLTATEYSRKRDLQILENDYAEAQNR